MPVPKPDACTVNGNSAVGRSRNIVDSLGLSQIRLTGFCSDNLAATIEPGSHDHRDRDATVDVERVVFANEGTNLPANSDFLTFVTIEVRPVLEGVVNNCDGTYTAYFGYDNRNSSTVVLPHGSENRFNYQGVELVDMGQTETFESGRMIGAFSVEFDGSALVWKLGGATATAEAGSATGDACGQ